MIKKRLSKREKEIKKYYTARFWNLAISFSSSYICGLLAAISISVLIEERVLEQYREFGIPLLIWMTVFLGVFIILFLIFYFLWIYLPEKKELSEIKK